MEIDGIRERGEGFQELCKEQLCLKKFPTTLFLSKDSVKRTSKLIFRNFRGVGDTSVGSGINPDRKWNSRFVVGSHEAGVAEVERFWQKLRLGGKFAAAESPELRG